MKRYLVIGAGVAGCTAAGELARLGHRITLVESTGTVGGKAVSYACKATDTCSRCAVCVAHSRVAEALREPRITLLQGASIQGVEESGRVVRGTSANPRIRHQDCTGCWKCVTACPTGALSRYSRGGLGYVAIDYSACLLHSGKNCTECVSACPVGAIAGGPAPHRRFTLEVDGTLIAAGHETFSPVVKPRLGYGRFRGVITGFEAEKILRGQTWLPAGTSPPTPAKSVAFIQCVGSRDPTLKRNFCSAVCCGYALRMARLLKARNPDADVAVYFIDIQNFDKVFTPLRSELEGMGIRFLRGIPSSVTQTAAGRLSLSVEDPAGKAAIAEHDAVVLSTGIAPTEGAARLADLFGLETDEAGFLRSRRRGVGVAGTCAEPRSIVESISSARAAALELAQ